MGQQWSYRQCSGLGAAQAPYLHPPTLSHVNARHPAQDHQLNTSALLRLCLHQ